MLQLCCSVAALVSKKRGGSRECRGLRWCGVRWCGEGREARVEGVGWVGGGGSGMSGCGRGTAESKRTNLVRKGWRWKKKV